MLAPYLVAITERVTSPSSRYARRHPGTPTTPLLHALDPSLPKASRTGKNYRAVCGESVSRTTGGQFNGQHSRACAKCARIIYGEQRER